LKFIKQTISSIGSDEENGGTTVNAEFEVETEPMKTNIFQMTSAPQVQNNDFK
jgi:hypothetical protein